MTEGLSEGVTDLEDKQVNSGASFLKCKSSNFFKETEVQRSGSISLILLSNTLDGAPRYILYHFVWITKYRIYKEMPIHHMIQRRDITSFCTNSKYRIWNAYPKYFSKKYEEL